MQVLEHPRDPLDIGSIPRVFRGDYEKGIAID